MYGVILLAEPQTCVDGDRPTPPLPSPNPSATWMQTEPTHPLLLGHRIADIAIISWDKYKIGDPNAVHSVWLNQSQVPLVKAISGCSAKGEGWVAAMGGRRLAHVKACCCVGVVRVGDPVRVAKNYQLTAGEIDVMVRRGLKAVHLIHDEYHYNVRR